LKYDIYDKQGRPIYSNVIDVTHNGNLALIVKPVPLCSGGEPKRWHGAIAEDDAAAVIVNYFLILVK